MNKKGQSFLVIAIIVVLVVFTLTSFINQASFREDSSVPNILEEIDFEVSQVINQGVYTGNSQEEISETIKDFVTYYAKTNLDKDIIIYYGNDDGMYGISYDSAVCENQEIVIPSAITGRVFHGNDSGNDSGCNPSWSCGSWGSCDNGNQTRTCTDVNSCGTNDGKPAEIQSCTPSCNPSWSCGSWGACAAGEQTRTCSDDNSCGVDDGKPGETQGCNEGNETSDPNTDTNNGGNDPNDGGVDTGNQTDGENNESVPGQVFGDDVGEPKGRGNEEDSGTVVIDIKEPVVLTKRSVGKSIELDERGVFEISPSEKSSVKEVSVTPRGIRIVEGERVLEVEVKSGEDIIVGEIKEFGKKRIGNYEIAVKDFDDEKIDVSIVTKDAIEETKKAVSLAPGIDEGYLCFDFEGSSSGRVVEGKRVLEGTPEVREVDGKKITTVKFGDYSKDFELRDGQNFFIVVKKERDSQRFVATN